MNRVFVLRDGINAKALWSFLKLNWLDCAQAGKPLSVEVAEFKAKRSIPQNKRLHALLTTIAEQAWVGGRQFAMESWKEQARRKFIGVEEIPLPDGRIAERGISTTTLSTEDFSIFMDRIEQWAVSELSVDFEYA